MIRAEEILRRAGDLCGVLDDSMSSFAAGFGAIFSGDESSEKSKFADDQIVKHAQQASASSTSSLTRCYFCRSPITLVQIIDCAGLHSQAYALANNRLVIFSVDNVVFVFAKFLSRVLAVIACYEATVVGGVGAEGAVVMAALVEAKRLSQGLGLRKVDAQLLVLQASIAMQGAGI